MDDETAGQFPPPDADAYEPLAEHPDPAFGETDDDDDETPIEGEPG